MLSIFFLILSLLTPAATWWINWRFLSPLSRGTTFLMALVLSYVFLLAFIVSWNFATVRTHSLEEEAGARAIAEEPVYAERIFATFCGCPSVLFWTLLSMSLCRLGEVIIGRTRRNHPHQVGMATKGKEIDNSPIPDPDHDNPYGA